MDVVLISRDGWDLHSAEGALVFRHTCRHPRDKGRFFRYDLASVTETDWDYYLFVKFGPSYAAVISQFQREPDSASRMPGGTVAACDFRESVVRVFSADGQLLTEVGPGEHGWHGHALYSIALVGGGVWAAYPTANAVVFHAFGGAERRLMAASPFNHPEALTLIGSKLVVCDMGNQRICEVDLQTLEIRTTATFREPVWEYLAVAGQPVVRLSSGIYRLQN